MPPAALLAPRYWATWCVTGGLAVLAQLPWRLQLATGRVLGHCALRFARRRRRIAEVNLAACLPELDADARRRLLVRHFEALGIGLIEVAACWWMPTWRLRHRVRITGLEHLEHAAAHGCGVLLLTAHFTTLEMGGRLLGLYHPVLAVYRPHENALIDYLMRRRRRVRCAGLIRRGDLRGMLQALRRGEAIWYAPDQAYLGARGVDAPFFGIPAPTNTATARIAAASGASVLPFFVRRRGDGGYDLEILPPLRDFPTGAPAADAARINAALEQGIRRAPAQYLWSHDRFKRFRRP